MFLIAITVFTTGSILSSIAPNIELLIVVRFIQENRRRGAVTGGYFRSSSIIPLVPSAASDRTVQQHLPHRHDHRAEHRRLAGIDLGLRSVSWLNIPIGTAVFIFGLIMSKPQKRQGGKLDMTGAGLLAGTLSTLMVGLSVIGSSRDSTSWIVFLVTLAISGIFFYFFLRHERR